MAPLGSPAYPKGHFYNWVTIRKSVVEPAEEKRSLFSNWPVTSDSDTGKFTVGSGLDMESDGGKNTTYLVALPSDVAPGDTIRVYGHCLYHGEYVDFLTI